MARPPNAQIAVAAFRYFAEDGAVAGRDLLGDQPQPSSEVAAFREGIPSADRSYHRARSSLSQPRLDRLNRLHNALIEEAWLVERHIVRGPLEPVEHLHWTAQRFEVARCQLRVDMAVVAAQEEEGDFKRTYLLAHVDAQ